MMKIQMVQSSPKTLIIRSLISIILGVSLMIWSDVALKVIVMLIGGVFFITGLMAFINSQRMASESRLAPINGIGSILLGLVLLLAPWFLVEIMVILIGIALLFAGFMQMLALSMTEKSVPVAKINYLMPVILVILGFLIIFQPWNIANFVVVLLGASITFYGISDIVNLLVIKNINKTLVKHQGDVENVEYEEER